MSDSAPDFQAPLKAAFNKVVAKPPEQAEEAKEEIKVKEEVAAEEVAPTETTEEIVSPPEEGQAEVVAEEQAATTEEGETEESSAEEKTSKDEEVQQKEDESVISDWDTPKEGAEGSAEIDFMSLAKEAGFEATSKDEFVSKVSEFKAKAESPDPITTLPDNLKKAIEIANQDGNYLEYLGVTSVDYDAHPDIEIVKAHYAQMFTNANGTVDAELLDMKIEGMTEADIQVEGQTLKGQYKQAQAQKTQAMEVESTRNREAADIRLKDLLNKTDSIDDFKLSPTNKKRLYDGITSGNMIAEMFHGADGVIDTAKVLKAYSKHLYGDKQMDYLRQKITTKVTKQVLDRLSNKQIEPKAGGLPNVEPPKKLNTQEKIAADVRERGADAFKPVY